MSDAAPEKPTKKIYRSRNDRLLGGVLAGIAESQG
ncbi:PspC domain-containing protein [Corynebacterium amycolatum]|nr:PspC domain-containing protein [Corynebacterium amycolatum]MDK7314740.1 PspC domain-containing protein [Corynebacterium amycolatum]